MNLSRVSVAIFLLLGIGFASPAYAPPPGACSPWPACKNNDPGGGEPAPYVLEFEPRFGSIAGRGLLTHHDNHGLNPDDGLIYDWSGRSCEAYPNIGPVFPIHVERHDEGNAFVFTGGGPDIIIDLVAPEVSMNRICGVSTLDGCFDSTNGQFTYIVRKTGKGRNKGCEVEFSWDFGYCEQGGNTEYINMSSGPTPIDVDTVNAPLDKCLFDGSIIDWVPLSSFTFTPVENGIPMDNNSQTVNLSFWLSRSNCTDHVPGTGGICDL